mmetsp:Transcript_38698/g.120396  ORF Transcript_38698/g.120396 Transcript_38698/m.120396 type:complete len:201 (+) Transcript_38698:297-899(+)
MAAAFRMMPWSTGFPTAFRTSNSASGMGSATSSSKACTFFQRFPIMTHETPFLGRSCRGDCGPPSFICWLSALQLRFVGWASGGRSLLSACSVLQQTLRLSRLRLDSKLPGSTRRASISQPEALSTAGSPTTSPISSSDSFSCSSSCSSWLCSSSRYCLFSGSPPSSSPESCSCSRLPLSSFFSCSSSSSLFATSFPRDT